LELVLGSRQGQLLAVLVLSVICCATALAATSPITACDRTADLQSLDVSVDELSIIAVGHPVTGPENQDDATLDALPTHGQSDAPVLDLTPRVVVILEDVFSAVAIETASSELTEKPILIGSSVKGELPLSPVAGDASQSESLDLADPGAEIEDADTVHSIQRQMFRTDI
jgi:hypothetical protein